MKNTKAIISCIMLVCVFILNTRANEEKKEARTPEFTIQVPKDHLFLVAIDRGELGNRLFLEHPEVVLATGVDPVTGNMMHLPAEVIMSLAYPQKRENNKSSNVMWKVYAGYRYSEKESEPLPSGGEFKTKLDLNLTVGYNFQVATKVQRIIYQQDGEVHNDYVRNIIETPVTPKLEEVETGVEGTKLYQVPFGEVEGVTRYIVILVADNFDSAKKVLLISNENPKFTWSTAWFNEQPIQK